MFVFKASPSSPCVHSHVSRGHILACIYILRTSRGGCFDWLPVAWRVSNGRIVSNKSSGFGCWVVPHEETDGSSG